MFYFVVYRDIEEWEENFNVVNVNKIITHLILVFNKISFVINEANWNY